VAGRERQNKKGSLSHVAMRLNFIKERKNKKNASVFEKLGKRESKMKYCIL